MASVARKDAGELAGKFRGEMEDGAAELGKAQGSGVERVDEDPIVSVMDKLGRPAVGGGHHRHPGPPRLEHDDPERFEATGHDEELGARHRRSHRLTV